jgi:hypothetical protein
MTAVPHPARAAEDPYRLRTRMLELDPIGQAQQLARLFHKDFQRALLAQVVSGYLMTIAPPRMTRILIRTGELEHRARKRLADQVLIHHEMLTNGFAPGRGRDALRRMNEMHRKYDITAEDFAAVSVCTTLGQIESAQTYGWREVTDHEITGVIEFERVQALHMNIHDIPTTVPEMVAFRDDYFDRQVSYAPQNRRLAESAIAVLGELLPEHDSAATERILLSVVDPRVVAALGYDYPEEGYRAKVVRAARAHAAADATEKGAGGALMELIARIYPDGYEIARLGTHLRSDEPAARPSATPTSPPPMCPV